MKHALKKIGIAALVTVCTGVLSTSNTMADETRRTLLSSKVPQEYQGKRMPAGWWTDPKIIKEGKRLYEGTSVEGAGHSGVFCAVCHGFDGRPLVRGVRDLTHAAYAADMSEAYWYWRVASGVPRTQMMGWKEVLTEDQIWKVIAYEHTFSHEGRPRPHNH